MIGRRQSRQSSRVDPALLEQLERAKADAGVVQAVFLLHPLESAGKGASPESAAGIIRKLLDRVEKETGDTFKDLNVFRNLDSFAVEASPKFIEKIIEQEEIASATANRQPGEIFIRPRKRQE